jgi:ElaB/YqjD/DUF883 family membrane-anchored ribosome-binding protein
MQSLRKFALALPETEEGIACKGTAIECATVMVRNKAFLFLGKMEIRFKLDDSLAEAAKLAAKEPDVYKVGAKGWTSIAVAGIKDVPIGLMKRWIGESYRLMAPKQLAASTNELPKAGPKKTARPDRK